MKTNFYTLIFKAVSNKKAQIILPAVMIVPIILLSIYLLFETTKISRAKIRSQFALDSAAAAELAVASNYLNGTAYVNGAFPYRLFKEMFAGKIPPDMTVTNKEITVFDFFYEAGAIPAPQGMKDPPSDATEWVFKHKEKTDQAEWDNTENPKADAEYYNLTSEDIKRTHMVYMINEETSLSEYNEDSSKVEDKDLQGIMWLRLYLYFYSVLNDIYKNQKKVYESIANTSEIFRKAYYLNAGEGACKISDCGREGSEALQGSVISTEGLYIKKIFFFFRNARSHTDIHLDDAISVDALKVDPIFQLAFLSSNSRSKLKGLYVGVDIKQPFTAPNNYFNVNLNAGKVKPYNHVRAALQCAKGESNNCIWPNPTSKYQVRLYP